MDGWLGERKENKDAQPGPGNVVRDARRCPFTFSSLFVFSLLQVLLPQYPIHPNLLSIDHTQPAKLQDPEAEDLKLEVEVFGI